MRAASLAMLKPTAPTSVGYDPSGDQMGLTLLYGDNDLSRSSNAVSRKPLNHNLVSPLSRVAYGTHSHHGWPTCSNQDMGRASHQPWGSIGMGCVIDEHSTSKGVRRRGAGDVKDELGWSLRWTISRRSLKLRKRLNGGSEKNEGKKRCESLREHVCKR